MSQSTYEQTASRGWFTRFLDVVERLGNLLPHPVTLFALFALGVIVVSGVAGWFDLSVVDPRPEGASGRSPTGEIVAISLMNGDGLRRIMESLVTNFTSFVPLGTVLVAMLGVGVAEKSGLLSAMIRAVVLKSPPQLVTGAVVFAGVVSNTASEMGYVVLIPLAAVIFHALGRHPFAGLAAAFALLGLAFFAAVALGERLAGRTGATLAAAGALVWSIVPIATAYHVAHYLPSLAVDVQYALAALADPFRRSVELFGSPHLHVHAGALMGADRVWLIWNLQAAAIVGGHLLAVLVAHVVAFRLHGSAAGAARSQLPLAVLMVGYTVLGLWLLSAPTAG